MNTYPGGFCDGDEVTVWYTQGYRTLRDPQPGVHYTHAVVDGDVGTAARPWPYVPLRCEATQSTGNWAPERIVRRHTPRTNDEGMVLS